MTFVALLLLVLSLTSYSLSYFTRIFLLAILRVQILDPAGRVIFDAAKTSLETFQFYAQMEGTRRQRRKNVER